MVLNGECDVSLFLVIDCDLVVGVGTVFALEYGAEEFDRQFVLAICKAVVSHPRTMFGRVLRARSGRRWSVYRVMTGVGGE